MNLCDVTIKIRQFFDSVSGSVLTPGKNRPDTIRRFRESESSIPENTLEEEIEILQSIPNEDFLNVEHPDLEESFDLENDIVSNANPVASESEQSGTNEESVAETSPTIENDEAVPVLPYEESPMESKKEESLLDNRPLVKLAENVVRLGDDIARHLPTLSQEAAEFAQYISGRLDEMLLRCGLDPIEDETSFHIVRHQAVPPGNIPNGTPITATLVPGLRLEERVLRRAKVTVELDVSPQDKPQDDTVE